jgi:hypothetical protein
MPAIEPGDTVRLAAQDLITTLQNKNKLAPFNLTPRHMEALQQLADIFCEAAGIAKTHNEYTQPRVQPSSSYNHTSPRVLKEQKTIHQHVTRCNQPVPTVFEENEEENQQAGDARTPTPHTPPT